MQLHHLYLKAILHGMVGIVARHDGSPVDAPREAPRLEHSHITCKTQRSIQLMGVVLRVFHFWNIE
jgi:hypothetical protein